MFEDWKDWYNSLGAQQYQLYNEYVTQHSNRSIAEFEAWHTWLEKYFEEKVRPFQKEPEPPNDGLVNSFLVGCDPEFLCLDARGQLYVPPLMHQGRLGMDHNGRLVEARPEPDRSSVVVWRRIKDILTGTHEAEAIKAVKWRSGGVYIYPNSMPRESEPLGGHVHLGVPCTMGSDILTRRLAALDAVTTQLEGCDILPRAESTARRAVWNGLYGTMDGGDGHVRASGHPAHLEYRAPASWLFSSRTALLVLTMYKLALSAPGVTAPLKGPASLLAIRRFLEQFYHKDRDVDFLRAKLERPSHARGNPDTDVKEAWRDVRWAE